MKKITELTAELAAPVIAEQGCTLWDVEYVKEAVGKKAHKKGMPCISAQNALSYTYDNFPEKRG